MKTEYCGRCKIVRIHVDAQALLGRVIFAVWQCENVQWHTEDKVGTKVEWRVAIGPAAEDLVYD